MRHQHAAASMLRYPLGRRAEKMLGDRLLAVSPSDDEIGTAGDCFGTDGRLGVAVLHDAQVHVTIAGEDLRVKLAEEPTGVLAHFVAVIPIHDVQQCDFGFESDRHGTRSAHSKLGRTGEIGGDQNVRKHQLTLAAQPAFVEQRCWDRLGIMLAAADARAEKWSVEGAQSSEPVPPPTVLEPFQGSGTGSPSSSPSSRSVSSTGVGAEIGAWPYCHVSWVISP